MNNIILRRITTILSYSLLAVSVILAIIFFINSGNIDTDASTEEQIRQVGPSLNYYLLWATILAGLTSFFSLVFPIGKMILNPKNAIKTLIMIVGFVIIIFIGRSLASDELLTLPGYDGNDNVPERLKLAGTVLYTMYFLLAGVILSIAYSEVSRVFK
ncbi:hypothetical protein ACFLSI_06630 [Bacteroidota bacterium]